MMEILLTIALAVICFLYLELKSKNKIIDQLDYKIRHLTGNYNQEDKKENQNYLDDFHFGKIIREMKEQEEYFNYTPHNIIFEEANKRFKKNYGYEFKDPFKNYK